MKMLLILLYFIRDSSAQYAPFFSPDMHATFYEEEVVGYPNIPYASGYQERQYDKLYANRYDYENYDYLDSQECVCSCSECERPKPCCREMCSACHQPNVVVMPYPYPLLISTPLPPPPPPPPPPPITTNEPTRTTEITTQRTTTTEEPTTVPTTTTEASTTTSTAKTTPANLEEETRKMLAMISPHITPRKVVNDIFIDDIIVKTPQRKNVDGKYILTSFRRTKADWKPKYGIVPIPGHLAERLMSQLRHMKNIN